MQEAYRRARGQRDIRPTEVQEAYRRARGLQTCKRPTDARGLQTCKKSARYFRPTDVQEVSEILGLQTCKRSARYCESVLAIIEWQRHNQMSNHFLNDPD